MWDNLEKLLRHLSDGKFHSGELLGNKLGITRSAVWKLTELFADLGIELEAVTGKGYRIPHGLELLTVKKIKNHIAKENLSHVRTLKIFNQIDSTNDYLMQRAASLKGVNICLAEQQTEGKGRWGRSWFSPFGANILLSILFPFLKDVSELSSLSLVIAVSVSKVLLKLGIKKGLGLKWPNDVFWEGKKIAGILTEIFCEAHGINHVVIGIGINVNVPQKFAKEIDKPWTDIAEITGTTGDRNKIAGLLVDTLIQDFFIFQKQGLKPFLKCWRELDVLVNEKVKVVTPLVQASGIAKGIDDEGRFILKDHKGKRHVFISGEVVSQVVTD